MNYQPLFSMLTNEELQSKIFEDAVITEAKLQDKTSSKWVVILKYQHELMKRGLLTKERKNALDKRGKNITGVEIDVATAASHLYSLKRNATRRRKRQSRRSTRRNR